MFKQLLSAGILLLLLVGLFGYYPIFKIQQRRIQKEIKHRIKASVPQNELHHFYYTSTEFAQIHWTKTNKEFRIGESMYDVVNTDTVDGRIHLSCVNDVQESRLFTHLNEMVNESFNGNSNKSNSVRLIHKIPFLFQYFEQANHSLKTACSTVKLHSGCVEKCDLGHLTVFTPPPQFLSA